MGIQWIDGYSATVESYLVIEDRRYRLAITNGADFTLGEECVAAPGTPAQFEITIDGNTRTTLIVLPDGMQSGQRKARYIDPARSR